MKTEETDFLVWLHRIREEAEAERKQRGLSGAEWLREVSRESKAILKKPRRRVRTLPRVPVKS
jgi:hypothetical protein